MKYGPNSEQVEAYLEQVSRIDAEGWAASARSLADAPGLLEHSATVIELARSRATRNGLRSEVDAAARAARQALDATLEASPARPSVLEPAPGVAPSDAATRALTTAVTSSVTLLVLRPLLTDVEFSEAWPMPAIDPRRLPRHLYVPPMGAVG